MDHAVVSDNMVPDPLAQCDKKVIFNRKTRQHFENAEIQAAHKDVFNRALSVLGLINLCNSVGK